MLEEIDLEGLFDERMPAPSGTDLEYDPTFAKMEQAAQGKPEQQYGDTIIEAEPPEWGEVESNAKEILGRSHDLRAAVYLACATLSERGLVSFASVIGLVKGYIENYWDSMNPILDPEDDNDPTIRINSLMTLCDPATTLNLLNSTPLVKVKAVGEFGLRDWRFANGDVAWPEASEQPKPELSLVLAAFQACELDELEQIKDAAKSLLADVKKIEELVTDQVGSAQSCNFETLVKELVAINRILEGQFSLRAPAETDIEVDADSVESEVGDEVKSKTIGTSAKLSVANLAISSRNEAIKALDKVCEYFEKYEPSSPLPLLLKRARRLSSKSFVEIIRDISPDGMHQVASLSGLSEEPGDSTGTDLGHTSEESNFSGSGDDDY
ncbi:MAG: type VI secretion system protein ImpA [Mariniblastus sp.]|jgi:type VI secretion system protein ImpA